jgi:hypothetical protein
MRAGRLALCLWNIETGAEVKVQPPVKHFWWREHGRILLTLGARADDKDYFGTGSLDNSVTVMANGEVAPRPPNGFLYSWEFTHPAPTYLLDGAIRALSFSDDGSRLVVDDVVWEVEKNAEGYYLRRSSVVPAGPLLPVLRGRDEIWAVSWDRAKTFKSKDEAYATIYQLAPEKRKFVLPRPEFPEIDKQFSEGRLGLVGQPDFRPVLVALHFPMKASIVT